ncbi:MAG: glycerol-3-phosphate dehydrogenase (NAD(P)+) [Bacteroidia bacterium]
MANEKVHIGVLGGGSWATALVKILCDNDANKEISWWLRDEEKVEHIQTYGHNPSYLSSVYFNQSNLTVYSDLALCLQACQYIILAIPSAFVHQSFTDIDTGILKGKTMVSAVKGLIPETGQILGEYMVEHLGIENNQIAVITGPCHAEEVAMEKLSYLTIASENSQLNEEISGLLVCRYIKTTASDDIYGTEYSAVLKNIYAIAAGICHSMGYGDNFLAVLVSNGIREIKRFIAAVHPIERDIDDSAYLGDLMVTAYSQFSRNRTFGGMLGKGYSVRSAQIEMNMIAEGYYATKTIYEINQEIKVDMPIVDFVHAIIYQNKKPRHIITDFLDQLN